MKCPDCRGSGCWSSAYMTDYGLEQDGGTCEMCFGIGTIGFLQYHLVKTVDRLLAWWHAR